MALDRAVLRPDFAWAGGSDSVGSTLDRFAFRLVELFSAEEGSRVESRAETFRFRADDDRMEGCADDGVAEGADAEDAEGEPAESLAAERVTLGDMRIGSWR